MYSGMYSLTSYDGERALTRTGHVHIWSYISQSIVKTFELTDVPVRAGRFIARKNWIVAGRTRPPYNPKRRS